MKMNCDVCGQDLRDENGYNIVAVQVSLLGANPMRKKVEEIFGKNKFNICHVCWLKSLGVKPITEGYAEVSSPPTIDDILIKELGAKEKPL